VKLDLEKDFLITRERDRKGIFSEGEKPKGNHQRTDQQEMPGSRIQFIFLERVSFPFHLVRQVFIYEGGLTSGRDLVNIGLTRLRIGLSQSANTVEI
jgi:hypothetical protein